MANTNTKKALIFLADGTEEMEFTITYDTLVRAGVEVTSVFVPAAGQPQSTWSLAIATCSRNVRIIADKTLGAEDVPRQVDLIVVPGGAKGADTISKNEVVQGMIKEQFAGGRRVGMICAGSLAAKTSKLPYLPITSHPSVKEELTQDFEYREESVVVDDSGKLITSRGPGTAFPFALKLVELLYGGGEEGTKKKKTVQEPMVFAAGTI